MANYHHLYARFLSVHGFDFITHGGAWFDAVIAADTKPPLSRVTGGKEWFMIGYTMVGTRDLKRAIGFYDPIFEEMGVAKAWRDDQVASWGDEDNKANPKFFIGYPFDGEKASVGNGTMTAFLINSTSKIDRLYEIAIDQGGSDEGKPGFRPQYGESFYAAYIRDPDGNKLAFVCYD